MTILDTIVEEKQREVARLPQRSVSIGDLQAALGALGERRDFAGALRTPKSGSVALIAEVKKASPSAGVIRPDFDPVRIARAYEAAGASCLSVLTDQKFFQGSLDYLKQIRAAVRLPLLRKDFIIDERQILEAIEWGADAVLLIVAILSDAQLKHFHALATGAGLAALVEVHDEAELDRALNAGAELIGVNNRNLKTFKVDLATTERLAACLCSSSRIGRIRESLGGAPTFLSACSCSRAWATWEHADKNVGAPPDPQQLANAPSRITHHASRIPAPLLVAESGINTRADVERLAKCGAKAILVGESLMKHADIGAKTRELLGG